MLFRASSLLCLFHLLLRQLGCGHSLWGDLPLSQLLILITDLDRVFLHFLEPLRIL